MTVRAVYENGIFRPTEPVDLPDRCKVEFDPKVVLPEEEPSTDPNHSMYAHIDPKMRPIYALLARRYTDDGPVRNVLETHNDHQP